MMRSVFGVLFFSAFLATSTALSADVQQEGEVFTRGKAAGIFYTSEAMLEELNSSECGPIDGGPYGHDAAIRTLTNHLTVAEIGRVPGLIEQPGFQADLKSTLQIVHNGIQQLKDSGRSLFDACQFMEGKIWELHDMTLRELQGLR